jgi:transposase InsO family protein
MPFTEVSIMDAREEFATLAQQEGANRRELCRRYGISPTTGYRWLHRYRQEGRVGLTNRPRRPHTSPRKTAEALEAAVVQLRQEHPAWGGRKLRARLLALGTTAVVPSASTITRILQRHDLLDPAEAARHRPWIRFEAAFPNDLWQMDYKGHFALVGQGRCHPLTVLDDHARFDLALRALPDERGATVQAALIQLFERYGLPNRILCDNGGPWGGAAHQAITALAVWLLHLDVIPLHGRPWHPQTQGKEERFHRTLQAELLSTRTFETLEQVQGAFDAWRYTYNHLRPHQALGMVPPITRYQPSPRCYPQQLPPIEYPATDLVRRVTSRGAVKLHGRMYYVGQGFHRYPVALRPTAEDAIYHVFFRRYCVAQLDLRTPTEE